MITEIMHIGTKLREDWLYIKSLKISSRFIATVMNTDPKLLKHPNSFLYKNCFIGPAEGQFVSNKLTVFPWNIDQNKRQYIKG